MRAQTFIICVGLLGTGVTACGGSNPEPMVSASVGWSETGVASWYGPGFNGNRTASGEVFDQEAMTAAHKTLPFGTIVRVENRDNGQVTEVEINDRGPFVKDRIIDLSKGAARSLDMLGTGTARVRISVVNASSIVECSRVQVGAFTDDEAATDLAERMERGGDRATVERGDDGLYHVLIGPYADLAMAQEKARRHDGLMRRCDD
jgi:rare lipoprotein A